MLARPEHRLRDSYAALKILKRKDRLAGGDRSDNGSRKRLTGLWGFVLKNDAVGRAGPVYESLDLKGVEVLLHRCRREAEHVAQLAHAWTVAVFFDKSADRIDHAPLLTSKGTIHLQHPSSACYGGKQYQTSTEQVKRAATEN
jgi:hypothetical protein